MKDLIDYGLSVFSTCWSLENIDSILGVILLILSIINIIYKGYLQISDKIKNKKFDEIDDVIEDVIEDIKDVKEEK